MKKIITQFQIYMIKSSCTLSKCEKMKFSVYLIEYCPTVHTNKQLSCLTDGRVFTKGCNYVRTRNLMNLINSISVDILINCYLFIIRIFSRKCHLGTAEYCQSDDYLYQYSINHFIWSEDTFANVTCMREVVNAFLVFADICIPVQRSHIFFLDET